MIVQNRVTEGAPDGWLIIDPALADGLDGVVVGTQIWVVTWLHQGQRDVFKVRPRGDPNRPLQGVFTTRSPAGRIRSVFTVQLSKRLSEPSGSGSAH
jgi:tRNA (Thr-GGU) A37 N-methylase